MKEIQQGIQQSTHALTQTTLVTTELTFLAEEINQMVTEFQGENETGDKTQVYSWLFQLAISIAQVLEIM